VIVDFDGVALNAEFDASTFWAFLAINDDLAGEIAVRLATQKAHHIGRPECGDGGGGEVFVDTLQIGSNEFTF